MTVPLYNLTDTWNNGATVFTAIQMNVTNTASAAGSLLMDLQIGSSSVFSFSAAGRMSFGGNVFLNPSGANILDVQQANGAPIVEFNNNGGAGGQVACRDLGSVSFGSIDMSNSPLLQSQGTFPNSFVLALLDAQNTTTAVGFHVYNTADASVNPSNYERGVFDWTTTANTLTIGTQALGTGTGRDLTLVSASTNINFGTGGAITLKTGGSADLTFTVHGQGSQLSALAGTASIFYTDNLGLNFSVGDTILSRGGAAKVLAIGTGNGDASGTILARTKAGAFVAGDIPAGTWVVGRDTSGATTKLYYNNAGTLMVVALV